MFGKHSEAFEIVQKGNLSKPICGKYSVYSKSILKTFGKETESMIWCDHTGPNAQFITECFPFPFRVFSVCFQNIPNTFRIFISKGFLSERFLYAFCMLSELCKIKNNTCNLGYNMAKKSDCIRLSF